jgi:arylformamidase
MGVVEAAPDLEHEYNVRLLHADRQQFYDRYWARSEAAYRELEVVRDVRYGAGARALMDVFLPSNGARGEGVPIVAFFHGGYWQAHERAEFGFVARAFAAAGICTALVGYDLAPGARMGTIVGQARAACAWIRANAGELGVDAGLVFTAGHSAGAHLAACVLTETSRPCAGAILVSGLYDLSPLVRTTINGPLGLTASTARRWSPVRQRLPARGDALVAVGAFETTEFIQQSHAFSRAWTDGGRSAELIVMPAMHHYDILLELDDPDSALSRGARHLVLRSSARAVRMRRRRAR